jgi:hypothetical protein
MTHYYLEPGNKVFYRGKAWKIISKAPGGCLTIRRWPLQLTVHKSLVF